MLFYFLLFEKMLMVSAGFNVIDTHDSSLVKTFWRTSESSLNVANGKQNSARDNSDEYGG